MFTIVKGLLPLRPRLRPHRQPVNRYEPLGGPLVVGVTLPVGRQVVPVQRPLRLPTHHRRRPLM